MRWLEIPIFKSTKGENFGNKIKKSFLVILITRSTIEIYRFPVLVDPSCHPLHRIGAWRQFTHLISEIKPSWTLFSFIILFSKYLANSWEVVLSFPWAINSNLPGIWQILEMLVLSHFYALSCTVERHHISSSMTLSLKSWSQNIHASKLCVAASALVITNLIRLIAVKTKFQLLMFSNQPLLCVITCF